MSISFPTGRSSALGVGCGRRRVCSGGWPYAGGTLAAAEAHRTRLRPHRPVRGRRRHVDQHADIERIIGVAGDGVTGEVEVRSAADLDEAVALLREQPGDPAGLAGVRVNPGVAAPAFLVLELALHGLEGG